MGIFDIFKAKKQELKSEYLPEADEIKQSQRDLYRQKKEYNDSRLKLDLELHKLKIEKEKIELQSEIERAKYEQEVIKAKREQEFFEMFGSNDEPEEGDTLDTALIKILGRALTPQNQGVPVTTPAPAPVQVVSLTHQQIKAQLDSLPANYKEMAKQMSDEDIRRFAIEQIPNIDAESTNRVVEVVRSLYSW